MLNHVYFLEYLLQGMQFIHYIKPFETGTKIIFCSVVGASFATKHRYS